MSLVKRWCLKTYEIFSYEERFVFSIFWMKLIDNALCSLFYCLEWTTRSLFVPFVVLVWMHYTLQKRADYLLDEKMLFKRTLLPSVWCDEKRRRIAINLHSTRPILPIMRFSVRIAVIINSSERPHSSNSKTITGTDLLSSIAFHS